MDALKLSGIKYPAAKRSDIASKLGSLMKAAVEAIDFSYEDFNYHYWVSDTIDGNSAKVPENNVETFGHRESVEQIFRICVGLLTDQIGTKKGFNSFETSIVSGREKGSVGPVFSKLYNEILSTLRDVISETSIRAGVINRLSASADLAVKIFGELNSRSALVFGTETFRKDLSEVLKEKDIGSIGFLADMEKSNIRLSSVDMLIIGNGGSSQINSMNDEISNMIKSKESSFLILDFESHQGDWGKFGSLPNVFYTHATSLDPVISRNMKLRKEAIPDVEKIIERQIEEFLTWTKSDKWDVSRSIIARSHQMQKVFDLIYKVAPTATTVIISGETGTGKELVAKAIHQTSPRGEKSFIPVNCGAIPENLLESTLFGYVKGAFTGASEDRRGIFQAADGGTLFLDEIGELPMLLQVKLLRALQNNEITPVGGDKSKNVNVRVIAATNKNLLDEVKNGTFREDLYYRLNVVEIVVPPLRERPNDILVLAEHFLRSQSNKEKKERFNLSPEAGELLTKYHWPGNVRELQNIIERVSVLSNSANILPSDLPEIITQRNYFPKSVSSEKDLTLDEIEEEHIRLMLRKNKYNYTSVAESLGIGRTTLWRKMKKYGIAEIDK